MVWQTNKNFRSMYLWSTTIFKRLLGYEYNLSHGNLMMSMYEERNRKKQSWDMYKTEQRPVHIMLSVTVPGCDRWFGRTEVTFLSKYLVRLSSIAELIFLQFLLVLDNGAASASRRSISPTYLVHHVVDLWWFSVVCDDTIHHDGTLAIEMYRLPVISVHRASFCSFQVDWRIAGGK